MEAEIPGKKDKLVIKSGELKGQVGQLIGIDGSNGIIKMPDAGIKIVDLTTCAKVVSSSARGLW